MSKYLQFYFEIAIIYWEVKTKWNRDYLDRSHGVYTSTLIILFATQAQLAIFGVPNSK